jgi:hypothetical protein
MVDATRDEIRNLIPIHLRVDGEDPLNTVRKLAALVGGYERDSPALTAKGLRQVAAI